MGSNDALALQIGGHGTSTLRAILKVVARILLMASAMAGCGGQPLRLTQESKTLAWSATPLLDTLARRTTALQLARAIPVVPGEYAFATPPATARRSRVVLAVQ